MKDIKWQHVVVVLGVLGVLGWLTYEGKDGATVIAGILALLGALGFVVHQQSEIKSQNEAIKQNTNGNVAQLLTELAETRRDMRAMADTMAMMQPPATKHDTGHADAHL